MSRQRARATRIRRTGPLANGSSESGGGKGTLITREVRGDVPGFDFRPGGRILRRPLAAGEADVPDFSGLDSPRNRMERSVKIADNLYVAIDYRLTLDSGEEIDRSPAGSPLGFVAGTGSVIPGLESALHGRSAGEKFNVTIEPEQAYGPVQDELIQIVPRERFPEGLEIRPGMAFQARGPRGPVAMTVAAVAPDAVTVDLNHPLAGKRLTFEVAVAEVRDPLPGELPEFEGGCACGPQEQSACGCGPGGAGGSGGGCGSSSGGGCGCG